MILQDRSFAGTSDGVAITASHYIKGLKRANILLLAKHFPSHGSVEINPHLLAIPTYEASSEKITSDLMPFKYLSKHIDGIMTSHVKVEHIDNQIATFSKRVINKSLPKKELGNLLIITDDLSEMGAIRKYMTDNKKSYGDIAIEAFDAGHDMLLFAHCNEKRDANKPSARKGQFTLDELRKVKESLTLHIVGVKSREEQFRNSLKKILKLKVSIANKKNKNWSLEQLVDKYVKDAAFLTDISGRSVMSEVGRKFNASFGLAVMDEPDQEIGRSIVRDAVQRAITTIHNKNKIGLLSEQESSEKIIFAVYDEGYEYFIKYFSPKFTNAIFLKIPQEKSGREFDLLEKTIKEGIDKADLLIYTAHDKSDADMLNRVRISHSKFDTKAIVLCHNSPGILDNALLNNTATIAVYTKHPIAFEVVSDVLSGQTSPKGVDNAPVSIGEKGEFYNVKDTKWIEPASIGDVPDLNAIENERTCRLRTEQKYVLVEKSWELPIRWFVVTGLLMFVCYLLHIYGRNPKVEYVWIKILAERNIFILLEVAILLTSAYFAIFGSANLHSMLKEGQVLSNEAVEMIPKNK